MKTDSGHTWEVLSRHLEAEVVWEEHCSIQEGVLLSECR